MSASKDWIKIRGLSRLPRDCSSLGSRLLHQVRLEMLTALHGTQDIHKPAAAAVGKIRQIVGVVGEVITHPELDAFNH
ncbi:MAG TPA: hypothetical protein PK034_01035, partial [Rugosibacter sp.]|nr:hypothetical protein [Rugosibacter sp.]